mmetsp:Transcript_7416/g.23282  ORF Transcript_7416/g.23282 Transcript_7416/m.23282 type:complete len:155 (+) Transcript_7416:116-580(+)
MRRLGGASADVLTWLVAAVFWFARTQASPPPPEPMAGGSGNAASQAGQADTTAAAAGDLASWTTQPPPSNLSDTEDEGLLMELEAERAGLRRRGIMGDQVMLSLAGMVALAIVAAGGVYRYRQRRPSGPSPQVLGRLLEEEHELSNGIVNHSDL